MTALLRVSVVADGRRLDLAVPPALPVAELVPGLARGLGVVAYDGLRLCTATGSVLDETTGLAPQDVPDGAVLTLAQPPPPPVVLDDPAEALAAAGPPGEPPRWLAATAAALLLLLGALTAAIDGHARPAAVLALLLLAAGIALGRAAPAAGAITSTAASGYAAIAAGLLAADLRPEPPVVWAASGGAALAVAALAMTGQPTHRFRQLPALVAAATATVVGAVLAVRPVPISALACVLLVLVVLLATAVPWAASGLISRPRGRVDPVRLADEARVARQLIGGLATGLAAVELVFLPVVAWQGPSGVALAGCGAAVTVLRARHLPPAEALPGLAAGGLGLLATASVALWLHESWRPAGSLVLAGVGGVLLTVRWPRALDPLARLLTQTIETACLIALLPLLVLATGVLEAA